MFSISFAKVDKAKNSTKVPPVGDSTTQVLLKDKTSLIRPTFQLHMSHNGLAAFASISQYNYCYVPEFKRYYWIRNITLETAAIVDIECEVDVLATFRDDILKSEAFVNYSESMYNSMIPDGRLPKTDVSHMVSKDFPITGIFNADGAYIISLAIPGGDGKTGACQLMAMDAGQVAAMSDKLYGQDVWDAIKDEFYGPSEAVLSCRWMPLNLGMIGQGSASIKFGKWELGSGSMVNPTYTGAVMVTPYLPHKGITMVNGVETVSYADYRNCEPYTEYAIFLPGVGLQPIPMLSLIGTGIGEVQFYVGYAISTTTGDITYNIQRTNDIQGGQNDVLMVKGNVAIDLPVGKGSSGIFGAIKSAAGAAAYTAIAVSTANPLFGISAAYGAMSQGFTAIQSTQQQYTATGALGGWSVSDMYIDCIYMLTRYHETSDIPSGINKTIGRPLFQHKKLNALKGICYCTGCNPETWATQEEHDMILSKVNGGGGIIIE